MTDSAIDGLDSTAWTPCIAQPGDALVFHGSVVHKSAPNRQPSEAELAFENRRDFLIAVFAAGKRQNRSVDGWFDGFEWFMPEDLRHQQLVDVPKFDGAPTVGLHEQSLIFGKPEHGRILDNATRFSEWKGF